MIFVDNKSYLMFSGIKYIYIWNEYECLVYLIIFIYNEIGE